MTTDRSPLMVRDYPQEERPRERMIKEGAQGLTNQELSAILLRTGTRGESVLHLATRILKEVGSLKRLHDASVEELMRIKGVGQAKAVQIKAGLELGRRVAQQRKAPVTIRSSHDAAAYLQERLALELQEIFYCLFLNTKNQIIHEKAIFKGSLNSSVVHPREVYKEGLKWSAASIIVAHNHPSGDPTPSKEDILVTKRLKQAGDIIGIHCLDHLIIGDGRYLSLKEEGYM